MIGKDSFLGVLVFILVGVVAGGGGLFVFKLHYVSLCHLQLLSGGPGC